MQPWLVEMAVVPKSNADREKLGKALAMLAAEDSSFLVSTDPESSQFLLKGMDELQFDSKLDILGRTYKVGVSASPPQVAYRETITRKAKVDHTYKKLMGNAGEFARVLLEIEPNDKGKGYAFESRIVADAVPTQFIPGIEKGLSSVMASGVVAGFPVIDVRVALVDGAYHETDASATTFENASRAALREGLMKAGAVLLEPVMKIEVATPEDYLGGVIGDLNSRRGQIIGTGNRGNAQIVNAMAPLANMLGYPESLRLMTQGRAIFAMQFDHYAPASLPGDDPPFRPATGMRA